MSDMLHKSGSSKAKHFKAQAEQAVSVKDIELVVLEDMIRIKQEFENSFNEMRPM